MEVKQSLHDPPRRRATLSVKADETTESELFGDKLNLTTRLRVFTSHSVQYLALERSRSFWSFRAVMGCPRSIADRHFTLER